MDKRIGILGCGHWGKNLIRNFYELHSLFALCDVDGKKLNHFKEKYKDLQVTDDYESFLTNPNVDAVVIATPVSTHYNLARKALLANKDVFVEKPISLGVEEGEELVFLAKEKKLILMVGHILEYHPAIVKIKQLVQKGDLGKINYIYSNRLNLGKFRSEENILWSFAPHDISVMLSILDEMPEDVSAHGGSYLNPNIADVTVTSMSFPSGVKAHIFVSWLHPYKEQRLVVVGEKKMVVFNDVIPEDKLLAYNHKIDWIDRMPTPRPEEAQPIKIDMEEPLKLECKHFIECIKKRKTPQTDGESGLRVLKILEACQQSLNECGSVIRFISPEAQKYFVHKSSYVDEDVVIGEGTKIWHFSHILKNSRIGKKCNIGQNVVIGPNVKIGNNVKIQNNVSVYDGVTLEDDVFCGPSMVFTNVTNPRSHWPRKDEYKETLVKRGATLGANSTVVCGITVGKYAFVGAGALANREVPDYALVYGIPARIQGWMCYCGEKLSFTDSPESKESVNCNQCGRKYNKNGLIVSEVLKK